VSVKELADTFARVNAVAVPYRFVPRRPGDIATCYADTTLARNTLAGRQSWMRNACAATAGIGNPTTLAATDTLASLAQPWSAIYRRH